MKELHQNIIFIVLFSILINPAYSSNGPLILTPYLEKGELQLARESAKVTTSPFDSEESYSGFFTIDPTVNSNIFFWFFPAKYDCKNDSADCPLLLWLNGGPGSSSLFGLFVENGPFVVNETDFISTRKTSWTMTNHVLFIDSPVGTGFSFTDKDLGYATSMEDVIDGLYSTLRQFFILFPEYRGCKFYLAGESFAGKYIPHLAQKILDKNMQSSEYYGMNLVGLSIGNGFIDPENSMGYSGFLYDIGLIDEGLRQEAEFQEATILHFIRQRKWIQAFQAYDSYIGYSGGKSFIGEKTGSDFYYNILVPERPLAYDSYGKYVNQTWARKALHVGQKYFQDGKKVMHFLQEEIMKSARKVFERLLNDGNLKILLYNGQLDLIVANRLTDSFISAMEGWDSKDKFLRKSPRKIWKLGSSDDPVGYYKTLGNFTRLTIRNCGHMVPYDQPKLGYLFIKAFLNGDFDT